jgi:hypothetical protein
VSDVARDVNCPERNLDRGNSLRHNRWSAEPVADFGAGRTTIECPDHAVEQSRNESGRQLGKQFLDAQFRRDDAD